MFEDTIQYLLIPSNYIPIFIILGCIFYFSHDNKKYTYTCFISAILIYFCLGLGPVSYWLMSRLEYMHPPLEHKQLDPTVKTIVVLTGYGETDSTRPLSSQLYTSSVYRLIESLAIYKHIPDAKIVISGSGDSSRLLKLNLLVLGLPDKDILLDDKSPNTKDSAVYMSNQLDRQFYLVTSAGHMPRAVEIFSAYNLRFIPMPTHYLSKQNILATSYLPTPAHLYISDYAIHEYIALANYRLNRFIHQ